MKMHLLILSAFALAAMIITSFGLKDSNEASKMTSFTATSNRGNVIRTIVKSDGGISTVNDPRTGPAYRFTVSATNGIGSSALSESSNSLLRQVPIKVGDYRDGGVVFYVAQTPTDLNGDGILDKGLVCAINDYRFNVVWWNGELINTGATATSVGQGQTNTAKIINKQGYPKPKEQGVGTYAAFVCNDHIVTISAKNYSDWFLPSIDELKLMNKNQAAINTTAIKNGGSKFSTSYLWSSTEFDRMKAETQYFNGPEENFNADTKGYSHAVRCVRAF